MIKNKLIIKFNIIFFIQQKDYLKLLYLKKKIEYKDNIHQNETIHVKIDIST